MDETADRGQRRGARVVASALLSLLFASSGACASYRFVEPSAASFAESYPRLALPLFENRSSESGLAAACTQALSARLRGAHTLVESDEAELVLEGVIVGARERVIALAPPSGQRAVEVEVLVRVDLFATLASGRRVETRDVEGSAFYMRANAPLEADVRRRAALEEACGQAVADATLRLMSQLGRSEVHGTQKTSD